MFLNLGGPGLFSIPIPFLSTLVVSAQVGMFEGLYRELLPMIDSVAASVEFMKVRTLR